MTLWCIARSPLILGCDMLRLDDFTLNLITNKEVLEVNQKSSNNHQLFNRDGFVAWTADMPGKKGGKYLALFNTKDQDAELTVSAKEVGVSRFSKMRDLWKHQDIGRFRKNFKVTIPKHGAVIYAVTK
jgi:hypothetical protein